MCGYEDVLVAEAGIAPACSRPSQFTSISADCSYAGGGVVSGGRPGIFPVFKRDTPRARRTERCSLLLNSARAFSARLAGRCGRRVWCAGSVGRKGCSGVRPNVPRSCACVPVTFPRSQTHGLYANAGAVAQPTTGRSLFGPFVRAVTTRVLVRR
jgi:hypothetical protein